MCKVIYLRLKFEIFDFSSKQLCLLVSCVTLELTIIRRKKRLEFMAYGSEVSDLQNLDNL